MSYILEALKRSEQERHQGELNHTTIDTIMMPSRQAHHQWWPYLLIVILSINLVVFLYFQFSEETIIQKINVVDIEHQDRIQKVNSLSEESIHDQEPQTTKSKVQQTITSIVNNSVVDQHVNEKPLPEHLLQTPKLSKRYDIVESEKPSKALNAYQSKTKTFTEEGFEIIKPKEVDRSVSSANLIQPKEEEVVDKAHEQIPASLESYSAPEEEVIVEQAQVENFEDTYHLNDMDLSFQKGIPDIRFNSHIYSTNPADRRVMINDLYLREGQSFSGIYIETIGEFYIVLSKSAQRFKISVLRDWYTPNK